MVWNWAHMVEEADRNRTEVLHDPEIVAIRSGRVGCDDQLGTAVVVEVASYHELGWELTPAAVDVGIHCVVRDRRHVLPHARCRIELQDPEIVAAAAAGVGHDRKLI